MRFRLRYLDPQHGVQEITTYASSEHLARESLKQRGVVILTCKHEVDSSLSQRGFSVSLFVEELLSLLNAGLNIAEGLHALRRHAQQYFPNTPRAAVLAQLEHALQKGECFSEALRGTGVFSELLIASVEASESTGGVSDALARFATLERERRQLMDALIAGSLYPLLVLGVGGAVVAFLMLYVVPRFSIIFAQMNKALPWTTQMLMEWGLWIDRHRQITGIGLALWIALMIVVAAVPVCRQWMWQRIARLPYLHERIAQFERARFYRALGTLLEAGIGLTRSMNLCRSLLSIHRLREGLDQAQKAIEQGQSLHRAFSEHYLIDVIGEQLLTAAEGRGQLPGALQHLAVWTESELRRVTTRFLRVLEPMMMVFIGSLVGVIVVLMYMPLFELTGNLL